MASCGHFFYMRNQREYSEMKIFPKAFIFDEKAA
jgi:hypothetical protein